jgi:hypothetical protein
MNLIRCASEHEYARLAWFKSSASQNNTACVEAARLPDGGMAVRDSKNPDGPAHMFTSRAWTGLLGAVRAKRP